MNLLLADADNERRSADRRYDDFLERVTRAMPWSAAERFRDGEHDAVDVGTRCFAIAVRLTASSAADPSTSNGNGSPVDAVDVAEVNASLSFNDKIHELAQRHGVDLFVHVGFDYVGVVGLTATYLDSVDRAMAFATAVLELAATTSSDETGAIGASVAIDTSPMRGAMRDDSPYGYQVWGSAIDRVQAIAFGTASGQLRMTDAVHAGAAR